MSILLITPTRGDEGDKMNTCRPLTGVFSGAQGMEEIGIKLGEGPLGLRVRMAYGMFDTRGR